MTVFVLGGTGSIGTAVAKELVNRSHRVLGLSRSKSSDEKLARMGAEPHRGDLVIPAKWVQAAMSCNAIIQIAATFEDDMGDVDSHAMSALVCAAESQPEQKRVIYTGGCWLYGETGDEAATENRPFHPLPSFAWMVSQAERLLNAPCFSTAVIHPARVYHAKGGGVFDRYITKAKARRPIEIWGDTATHWLLIERTYLARAYCDLLERPDLTGHFNAVAQQGVAVGDIGDFIGRFYSSPADMVVRCAANVIAENGAWAEGPMLDQQMSGQKLRHSTGWTPVITEYRRSDLFA